MTIVVFVYNCYVIWTVLFIQKVDCSVFISSNYVVKVFDRFLSYKKW